MPEATKYYANILMPFGDLIVKAVEKLGGLKIDTIAPSHGIIWRSHIDSIVKAYASWGKGETKQKVLVIYDTMWKSTEKMAHALEEVLDARVILIGSPTLNNGMFPTVAGFLCYLKGLKPKGKLGAAFGSHGWAGGALKAIEQELGQAGIEVVDCGLSFKFVPDKDEINKCVDFGKTIASRVK